MVAVGRMILLLVVVRGAVLLVVRGAVVLVVMGAVVQGERPNYCCHKITQSVPNLSSLLLYGA